MAVLRRDHDLRNMLRKSCSHLLNAFVFLWSVFSIILCGKEGWGGITADLIPLSNIKNGYLVRQSSSDFVKVPRRVIYPQLKNINVIKPETDGLFVSLCSLLPLHLKFVRVELSLMDLRGLFSDRKKNHFKQLYCTYFFRLVMHKSEKLHLSSQLSN